MDIDELILDHCPNAVYVKAEVRPGRHKVTLGNKTRTVSTTKRKDSYRNDFIAWIVRVC